MAEIWQSMTNMGVIGWVFLFLTVAVISSALVKIAKIWVKHSERMAMIERGMDPGSAKHAYDDE